jgi:hypothetical protein
MAIITQQDTGRRTWEIQRSLRSFLTSERWGWLIWRGRLLSSGYRYHRGYKTVPKMRGSHRLLFAFSSGGLSPVKDR